uniref:Uncharacterized protein n=1 Tax=Cacopsylla melanoneura TaxID=428564 RepID=A0A8D8VW81_9HEMI
MHDSISGHQVRCLSMRLVTHYQSSTSVSLQGKPFSVQINGGTFLVGNSSRTDRVRDDVMLQHTLDTRLSAQVLVPESGLHLIKSRIVGGKHSHVGVLGQHLRQVGVLQNLTKHRQTGLSANQLNQRFLHWFHHSRYNVHQSSGGWIVSGFDFSTVSGDHSFLLTGVDVHTNTGVVEFTVEDLFIANFIHINNAGNNMGQDHISGG